MDCSPNPRRLFADVLSRCHALCCPVLRDPGQSRDPRCHLHRDRAWARSRPPLLAHHPAGRMSVQRSPPTERLTPTDLADLGAPVQRQEPPRRNPRQSGDPPLTLLAVVWSLTPPVAERTPAERCPLLSKKLGPRRCPPVCLARQPQLQGKLADRCAMAHSPGQQRQPLRNHGHRPEDHGGQYCCQQTKQLSKLSHAHAARAPQPEASYTGPAQAALSPAAAALSCCDPVRYFRQHQRNASAQAC